LETWGIIVTVALFLLQLFLSIIGTLILRHQNAQDERLKAIEGKLDSIPDKMAKVHARVSTVEGEVKGIQVGHAGLKERHDRLEARFDEHVEGTGFERA
jgi:hypothetical protein